MFFAVLAPLCGGPVEKRKRLVFDILRRRVSFPKEGVAPNADVKYYMKYLRAIYLPSQVYYFPVPILAKTSNPFSPACHGRVSFLVAVIDSNLITELFSPPGHK
jgi:hypothetical protein